MSTYTPRPTKYNQPKPVVDDAEEKEIVMPERKPLPQMPEMAQPKQAPLMNNYRDILERVGGYQDRTQQLEKQRQRELSNRRLYQIFDGLNALSNLYATTKSAPNSYNPQQDLSRQSRARIDNIDRLRDANRQAYLNAYLRGYAQDLADQRYRQRNEDSLADAENRRRIAQYNKEAAEISAHNRAVASEELAGLRHHNTMSEINARGEQSRMTKQTASATSGKSGGRERYYGTYNGVKYQTKADYDKAVNADAETLGVNPRYEQTTGEYVKETKSYAKPSGAVAAENERKLKEQKTNKTGRLLPGGNRKGRLLPK